MAYRYGNTWYNNCVYIIESVLFCKLFYAKGCTHIVIMFNTVMRTYIYNFKNAKHQLHIVPHPFKSRAQYERSLQHPTGPEWNSANALRSHIAPDVVTRQGVAIAPLKHTLTVKEKQKRARESNHNDDAAVSRLMNDNPRTVKQRRKPKRKRKVQSSNGSSLRAARLNAQSKKAENTKRRKLGD